MALGVATLIALAVVLLSLVAAVVFAGPFAVFWAMLGIAVLMTTVIAEGTA